MSSARQVDPGLAQEDMITDTVDHDQLAVSIWTAMERATAATGKATYADINIPQLLRSMRETHGSMRAIYTAAKQIEDKRKEPTGRWADMLVLARSQFDALFIGILLAHDPEQWGPKYYKAGWATEAQHIFYAMRRFASVPSGREIYNHNVHSMKGRARLVQVTLKEWIATLASVRGKPLRCGAVESDKIKSFPTPGQIVELVKGGAYEKIAGLLWQEWKTLCDPAHSGLATIALRHAIRDQQVGELGSSKREKAIQEEILARSAHPSLVAIMTLTTILALQHRNIAEVMAAVIKGWEILEKGTREGGIVWDNWARHALGVLKS